MKLMLLVCIAGVALVADDPAKNGSQAAAQSSKPKATPKPLTEIPASAVEFEPGTFHYTDPDGKKWILRKTPFGIARIVDDGNGLRKKGEDDHSLDAVKITELGDSLRFERPGPFGTYKWEKKKNDLDDKERAAWEREKAKAAKKD